MIFFADVVRALKTSAFENRTETLFVEGQPVYYNVNLGETASLDCKIKSSLLSYKIEWLKRVNKHKWQIVREMASIDGQALVGFKTTVTKLCLIQYAMHYCYYIVQTFSILEVAKHDANKYENLCHF